MNYDNDGIYFFFCMDGIDKGILIWDCSTSVGYDYDGFFLLRTTTGSIDSGESIFK